MLETYNNGIFQDKEIKKLFPIKKRDAERKYNKEKKAKYENLLKELGLIAYDERYLNCNANETFSKIYRLNSEKSSNTASFGKNHYILMIPKSLHLKYFSMKHELTINEYKTIILKYLNQKASFQIYDDAFYYYIETFLRLPNYSKNVKYWIKKQIDNYILMLLREGKLVKKSYSDKITQNIEKSVKNRSYKHYFLNGYNSVLTLLNKSERENHLFGISRLRFKKSEIPFFHNAKLKIYLEYGYYIELKSYIECLGLDLISEYISLDLNKEYLLVRLKRRINERFVSVLQDVKDIKDLFLRFLNIGIKEISTIFNIDMEMFWNNVTRLELQSLEVARELSQFDKIEHRDIPVLKYGKSRKRDLGYIGFENYYDYIDFSSVDDCGNPIPEYEIQYFNRKNRTIDDFIRDIDFLLPFDIRNPIINEIDYFDITPSIEHKGYFENDLPLEYGIFNEINGLYGYRYRSKYRKDSIFNFT